jgi:AhpD family alkylhydroperoxidase
MKQRMNFKKAGAEALKSLYGISRHLSKSKVDKQLAELLYMRVSQINGCAYCLDMHSKELLALGETAQRLFVLDAWRETNFFSDRERAALAWAEALTNLDHNAVPDAAYEGASRHFSEEEIVDLTLAVTTINTYNRFNIAFGAPVGTYEIGQFS